MPPAAGAEDAHVVPLLVSTLPELLGATKVGADAPLPKMTLLAVRVVRLVPPLATGNAVPEYVIASVPDDVIGLPDMLKMLGTEAATLVTVPEVAGAVDDHVVPLLVITLPDVLGATNVGADAPLPKMTLLAVRVVRLVPPLATKTVPARVEIVGLARNTAAPAPAPSVYTIALVPVAIVTSAPEPCLIMML